MTAVTVYSYVGHLGDERFGLVLEGGVGPVASGFTSRSQARAWADEHGFKVKP